MRNLETPVESWNEFRQNLERLSVLKKMDFDIETDSDKKEMNILDFDHSKVEDFYWSRFKFYNKRDLNRLSLNGLINL